MRHRRSGRQFNRDTKSRKALMRSLATALVREGRVVTTEAKGKSLRSLADRLVTVAKGADDLQARRELHVFFGKRDVANVLVDRIVPLNADRISGYTTLSVMGNRAGDNSQMVEVKWINMPEITGTLRNPSPAPKNERSTKRSATIKSSKKTAVAKPKVAKLKPAAQKEAVKKAAEKAETEKPAAKKTATKTTKKTSVK